MRLTCGLAYLAFAIFCVGCISLGVYGNVAYQYHCWRKATEDQLKRMELIYGQPKDHSNSSKGPSLTPFPTSYQQDCPPGRS